MTKQPSVETKIQELLQELRQDLSDHLEENSQYWSAKRVTEIANELTAILSTQQAQVREKIEQLEPTSYDHENYEDAITDVLNILEEK